MRRNNLERLQAYTVDYTNDTVICSVEEQKAGHDAGHDVEAGDGE